MAKEETVVVVTEGMVAQMIAKALGDVATKQDLVVMVTKDELDKRLSSVVATIPTLDKIDSLAREASNEQIAMFLDKAVPAQLKDTAALELAIQPPLDASLLEGLVFRDAKHERQEVDGRPKLVATPIERPLLPEDVLAYRVDGDRLYLSTRDGKKHTVEL